MMESVISALDKFTPEILVILSGLLVITTTLFLWLWFANRRTYNLLRHQLPASVIKTYLDSVIQNSNSLKSALFRGGGADLSAGMPSSMPVIGGGENLMSIPAGSGNDDALREQLQQKLAELAATQSQLNNSNAVKKELETGLTGSKARIKELEDLLAKAGKGAPAPAAGGADPAELKKVSKERDELRDKLKEYEIIEDDLANLKRLQQENAQLKKALGGSAAEATAISGGSEPLAAKAAPVSGGQDPLAGAADLFDDVPSVDEKPEAVDEPEAQNDATEELEQFLSSGEDEAPSEPEAVEASAPEADEAPKKEVTGNEKTPEDLLSEFEKMLG
ncbi:MAG: hypothetical protein K2P81_17780 [Bacteriovoracaceae bacterium]|nr:hypothetical protein [Bacteriovoracaceae bacterium]